MKGSVIILNGPSSVGKSSIVKAFQLQQKTPWLATGIDHLYVGVIPPHWLDDKPEHHAIMTIKTTEDQDGKIVTAVFGPEGKKVIKGMHRAIAAYAHAGNNVIVDYIKYEPAWLEDLQNALSGIKTLWVKVTAPLDVIIKREKERGTSPEGHARSHYHTIHENVPYDVMVNTHELTPEESAKKISDALEICR
jgi:chloramphenicol 3-O phosphotransferase